MPNLEKDELQLAANFLVEAHKYEPTNRPVLLRLGNALRRLGQASKAIAVFERLLKLGIPDPPMLFDVGNLVPVIRPSYPSGSWRFSDRTSRCV